MSTKRNPNADPKRVSIGRQNQLKWKGFTPEGLARLRQSALAHRPWERSTGPRTPEGKARSARNPKLLQKGDRSVRELRAELAGLDGLFCRMEDGRALLHASGRAGAPCVLTGPEAPSTPRE